jgi:hypothetical protein
LGAFKLNQDFSINGGEMSEVSDSFNLSCDDHEDDEDDEDDDWCRLSFESGELVIAAEQFEMDL